MCLTAVPVSAIDRSLIRQPVRVHLIGIAISAVILQPVVKLGEMLKNALARS